ncbi:MAG: thiamine pyrophosphate-binding protein [Gammaproteobacteria bacterium]
MRSDSQVQGAIAVTQVLADFQVSSLFALGGAAHSHLLAALEDAGVSIISTRHETGTVGAADGYARVSGRLGVALIIADQGLPNAITGIATAFHAGSPVLVLVARSPDSWSESQAEFDDDRQSLVTSISKWARTVPAPDRLAEYVAVGARQALGGRPGPAVLMIPQDFFTAKVARPPVCPPAPASPGPVQASVTALGDLLAASKRPLFIAGAGAVHGQAAVPLRELSHRHGVPVVGNGLGRGVVAEDHELGFSWPYAQIAANQADTVVLVGARLRQRLGFGLPPRFNAQARFAQIDLVAEEFHRNRHIDVPVVADAGLAIHALLDDLDGRKLNFEKGWLGEALQARDAQVAAVASKAPAEPVHPLALASLLQQHRPEDGVYVGDGANIQNFMYSGIRITRAGGFLDHYPLGSMGIGLPLALGAAVAERDLAAAQGVQAKPLLLVTGDGSLGFYMAELASFVQAQLPVVVVVGNDAAWGTERHGQLKSLKRTVNTDLGEQAFDRVAAGLGFAGQRIDSLAGFEVALAAAFNSQGQTLFDVILDRDAGALTKSDPLIGMIMFNDLQTGREIQRRQ